MDLVGSTGRDESCSAKFQKCRKDNSINQQGWQKKHVFPLFDEQNSEFPGVWRQGGKTCPRVAKMWKLVDF